MGEIVTLTAEDGYTLAASPPRATSPWRRRSSIAPSPAS